MGLLLVIFSLWLVVGSDDVQCPVSIDVKIGSKVIIPCLYTGNYSDKLSTISWQFSNNSLTLTNIITNSSYGTNHQKGFEDIILGGSYSGEGIMTNVTVKNVTVSAEGTYCCIFNLFGWGSSKCNSQLRVTSSPRVETKYTIVNNTMISVSCVSTSRPSSNITWLVKNETKIEVVNNTEVNGLTVSSSSTYVCDFDLDSVYCLVTYGNETKYYGYVEEGVSMLVVLIVILVFICVSFVICAVLFLISYFCISRYIAIIIPYNRFLY